MLASDGIESWQHIPAELTMLMRSSIMMKIDKDTDKSCLSYAYQCLPHCYLVVHHG